SFVAVTPNRRREMPIASRVASAMRPCFRFGTVLLTSTGSAFVICLGLLSGRATPGSRPAVIPVPSPLVDASPLRSVLAPCSALSFQRESGIDDPASLSGGQGEDGVQVQFPNLGQFLGQRGDAQEQVFQGLPVSGRVAAVALQQGGAP